MERDPKAALALAQEACRLAPTLVPAAAICGRLSAQAGDYRRASPDPRGGLCARMPSPGLSPPLSAASATAIYPPTGLPAPARSPASRPTIPNCLEPWDARRWKRMTSPPPARRSPRSSPRFAARTPDPARLSADGRYRGGGRESRRGPRMARSRCSGAARQGLGGGWGHQRPSGAGLALWNARRVRRRTPDERIAAPAEGAVAARPAEAIAAPAAALAPAPQAAEPERPAAPAQAPTLVPAPRTGVIIDPASMAPDDPGPEEHESERRGFRLYANERDWSARRATAHAAAELKACP